MRTCPGRNVRLFIVGIDDAVIAALDLAAIELVGKGCDVGVQ